MKAAFIWMLFLIPLFLPLQIMTSQAMPDLEVSDMSLEPSITIHQGDTLTVKWTERNIGDADASYSVGIYLETKEYEKGICLAHFQHTLLARSSMSYSVNLTIPLELPPGKYYITVFVNDDNKTAELNKDNNRATCPIFVVEAYPDLRVHNVEVQPSSIHQGGAITVKWIESNAGKKASGPYRTGVYIGETEGSGYLLGSFQRIGLKAETWAEYTASFVIFGLPPGKYFVNVFIDDTNGIKELDENNNIISIPISVLQSTFTVFSSADAQSVRLCFESPVFMPSGDIIVGGPFVNYMSAAAAEESDISFRRDELIVEGAIYRSKWQEVDYAVILMKGGKIYVMGTHRYGTRAALLLLSRIPTFSQRPISYIIIKWQDLNGNKDVEVEEIKILRMG
ncbi:MAG: hypothetical protein DSO07_10215 [Thermoproteota archaeon]|uniref:CARDB domain-containing protein n=2 Tax=Candidatus Methanodesulfokora washburnensis TaxID=2478471 RepID=A0A3R9PIN4_9CREN|nr:hypothetical protein D6D85_06395 [Candidatus Methanodesulfokores washburnensis]RZN60051.1 MAG: hypothetical protein EF810_06280 [Candidatus Methanodesulfokores washburnensis]TDA39632.1 MAG: hypothetical protein DSO07_10215 [Candidatus Korarchaeota archaeon]